MRLTPETKSVFANTLERKLKNKTYRVSNVDFDPKLSLTLEEITLGDSTYIYIISSKGELIKILENYSFKIDNNRIFIYDNENILTYTIAIEKSTSASKSITPKNKKEPNTTGKQFCYHSAESTLNELRLKFKIALNMLADEETLKHISLNKDLCKSLVSYLESDLVNIQTNIEELKKNIGE